MTRLIVVSAVVALCSVAVLGAQAAGQKAPVVKGGSTIPLVPTVTLSGCVKSAAAANQYNLENASDVAAGASATKKTYAVSGMLPPGINLVDHVNHRVELMGTMVDPAFQRGNLPQFNVISVPATAFKMVAATCS